ncbi:MAG: hypothetical protein H0Z33_05115 [Bacillaceae bacterium]|nr:hypothetical protein [Bacillaceae bacterium]
MLSQALRMQPSAVRWLWLLAVVAAFQGLHNAIRVAYPEQHLAQGATGVGIVSTISTFGVLCGGWLASRTSVINKVKLFPSSILIVTIGLIVATAVFVPVVLPSYMIYFTFMVLFELSFMLFNMNFVTSTDEKHASILIGFRTTVLNASTLFGLALTSFLLLKFSDEWSTLFTSILLVGLSFVIFYVYRGHV